MSLVGGRRAIPFCVVGLHSKGASTLKAIMTDLRQQIRLLQLVTMKAEFDY